MAFKGYALIDASDGHITDGNGDHVVAFTIKSYAISDVGTADTHYLAGFYEAPSTDVTLTIGGSVTQTYGTAGEFAAAHAFVVASGAGGASLVLTVSGISITDAGVRNGADSEVIVADCSAAATNQYFETTKKWLGQVTYTLTGPAGSFTFNYGFCKYDDLGNRDFIITDFEMVLHGGNNETGFKVELLHHQATGWTYSAAAFVPGNSAICSSLTDHTATNDNYTNNSNMAYKRAGLSTTIAGNDSEGFVIRITTAVNNSIKYANFHIGAKLT